MMDEGKLELLREHAKNNSYVPHGNIENLDCVIGFSFGYREDKGSIIPGKTNEQLARFIENTFLRTPLILQFEINDALQHRVADLVISKSRQKGEYLNSREIALQAFEFMNEKGWKSAAIVTHPAMVARNDAICHKIGIETLLPIGLDVIEYDMESVQPWTCNKDAWWEREEIVTNICLENNWI